MRPFTDILRDIRKGATVEAATDELAELIQAVKATNKAGTLTLKLKINPVGRDGKQVEIVPNLSVSTPTPDLSKGIFFVDDQGDLLRDDPDQRPLFEERSALSDKNSGLPRGPSAIAG